MRPHGFPGLRAGMFVTMLAVTLTLPPAASSYTAKVLNLDKAGSTLRCEIVEMNTLFEDSLARFIGENGGASNASFDEFFKNGELRFPRPAADYFKSDSLSFRLDPDTNSLSFSAKITAGKFLDHPLRSTHLIDAADLIHAIDAAYHITDERLSSHPEFKALLLETFTAYRLRHLIQDSSFELNNGILQGTLRLKNPMPRIIGRGVAKPSDFKLCVSYKNVRERSGRNRHLKSFRSSIEEYLILLGVRVLKKGGEYAARIELFPGFEQDSRLFREAGTGHYGYRTNCSVKIFRRDRRIFVGSYDAAGVHATVDGARKSSARNLGTRAAEGIVRSLIKESFELRE